MVLVKQPFFRTLQVWFAQVLVKFSFFRKRNSKVACAKIVAGGLSQVPWGTPCFPRIDCYGKLLEMGAFKEKSWRKSSQLWKVFHVSLVWKNAKPRCGNSFRRWTADAGYGRALMSTPKLLLLDEPSMDLPQSLSRKFLISFKIFRSKETTVLLIEQNANKALAISDRGYVLETGKIVLSGTGKELAASDEVRKAISRWLN